MLNLNSTGCIISVEFILYKGVFIITDFQMVLVTVVGVIYVIFGAITAITDVCNQEITTPHDLRADGYNWFGSWTIFMFRSIAAFPFWILFTIVGLVYKFIMWLFTVGGKK